MQRKENGIWVITPPDFESYTGQVNGKGFVLDGVTIVVWADDEGLPAISDGLSALAIKDLDRTSAFAIADHRITCYSEESKAETERLLCSAFPALTSQSDWDAQWEF